MPQQQAADLATRQYDLALQLAEANQLEAAVFALRAVVALSPQHADAWNDLGGLYFQLGQVEKAVQHLRIARGLAPANLDTKRNLAEALLSLGEGAESRTLFEELLTANPADPAVREKLEFLKQEAPAVSSPQVTRDFRSVAIDYNKLRRWEMTIFGVTQKIADEALHFLPPGGVLLDIGANVGLFTAQVLAQRPCRAYLFEPVPEYWAYCCERFQGLPDVSIDNVALSDAPGSVQLWLGHENLGWNTMVGEKRDGAMREVTVEAITFDDWAEAHAIDRIDVIKLDVEGGEYKVLAGMHRTLARLKHKPVILCEIGWGPSSHPHWSDEVREFEWLFANGYERINYNVPGTSDVIFRPNQTAAADFRAAVSL